MRELFWSPRKSIKKDEKCMQNVIKDFFLNCEKRMCGDVFLAWDAQLEGRLLIMKKIPFLYIFEHKRLSKFIRNPKHCKYLPIIYLELNKNPVTKSPNIFYLLFELLCFFFIQFQCFFFFYFSLNLNFSGINEL